MSTVTIADIQAAAARLEGHAVKTPLFESPALNERIGGRVLLKLETLQRVTAADELVITSVTHRHADRLRSHELIAKRWGLSG